MSRRDDPETRAKRFRNKAEECRTSAEGMKNPDSRSRLLRLADTYERIAESFEMQPPCKVKGRDSTGRELEIFCHSARQAQQIYADFCERGYVDVVIQDLHGNSLGKRV